MISKFLIASVGVWLTVGFLGGARARDGSAPGPRASLVKPIGFTRDVRPILASHCFSCHGPDESQRKAKLRLDIKEGAFADHDGRRAFVPGKLAESEVIERINAEDPTEAMPPGGKDRRLTAEQVKILEQWVAEGAQWESHWAFDKPVRAPLPSVKDRWWPRNPIDDFVLARLERDGLSPSPEADRATLVRRVCLDLTGLPPTPEIAGRFLHDTDPGAYDRLVDRLLQSPAYGERWARMWLDLARYADTKGYEKDLTRTIWRYRDWVIDAFNSDMPYDRFTTLQLAGDLIPGGEGEQRLATAFHRNTLTNDEGGTDDEEFRIAAVKDRVDTTAQVWMGLTLGCAKCHSHKYDPISNREYYQFYAFFNQTEDSDRYDDGPAESFPSAEQQARQCGLHDRIKAIESRMFEPSPERLAALARWEDSQRGGTAWSVLKPTTMSATSGSALALQPDGSIKVAGPGPAREAYRLECGLPSGRITALRLEALPDPSLPKGGAGRSPGDGNFVLSGLTIGLLGSGGGHCSLPLASAQADFSQAGYPIEHVLKNTDVKKHGWAVAPRQGEAHQALFVLAQPAMAGPGARLVIGLDHQFEYGYPGFSMGRFRVSVTSAAAPKLKALPPIEISEILRLTPGGRTADQSARLLKYYLESTPDVKAGRAEQARLKAEIDAILASCRTPIYRELPAGKRRITKVHRRGNFLDPGDAVEAATPAFFPPLPKMAPRNRLGVAAWLLDRDNPLTARVAVNRHWAQFFGRGLVETQEDFGAQGQPPSHPELLDWLACEFRDGGWSMKRLCRLIVMSATYRQSSRVTPGLLQKDRDNRLLARGPRFRLEAEMIRDSALQTAGLLSPKMHGPSVMPHQPDGIWRSTYSTDRWNLSPGEDRYRRGLYTFIKRTSPYPALTTFDAPSREVCTVRRISTNTPLQALVTLNDPAYFEAAQALARRLLREAGPTAGHRIRHGLKLALIREPQPREVTALTSLYERRLGDCRAHPDEALQLATIPLGPLPSGCDRAEAAAMTAVSNVILNLDEFLTRN